MGGNRKIARTALTRAAAGMCALALALGLSGCDVSDALALVSFFTTPSLDEVEDDSVSAMLSSPSIIEDGVLTVAVDTSNAPQAMTSSTGEVTGYDIDVALAIAERLGLSVKIVSATDAEDALTSYSADIFIGTESDDTFDGSTSTDVYLQDATALFTDTTLISVANVDTTSLVGAVVAVQDASASQDALVRAGIDCTQQTYSNVNECFEALAAGEVQYVACDATAGAYLARSYEGVEFVGTLSSATSYTVTMLSASTELVEAVTEAFEDIAGDGTLAVLHTIWYGSLPVTLTGNAVSGVTIEGEETEDEDSSDDDSSITISGDVNSLTS